ncbi:MAG: hypothetical protein U5K38_14315 [Woeseiaceae bacterium]|nr:hypothetical protein [Woeseiaceae bacterium]
MSDPIRLMTSPKVIEEGRDDQVVGYEIERRVSLSSQREDRARQQVVEDIDEEDLVEKVATSLKLRPRG